VSLRAEGKRRMSPIAAMNVAAQITLTPGTVIRRLISAESSAWVAIRRSTASISRSRNSIWRMPASTDSRSSSGSSSSASHRRPSTPNRSLNGARPTRQRIRTAWISFLARARALTSWLRRCRRRRITRVRRSGIQTPSSSPAASSRASVRASRRSVFAGAPRIPVSVGDTTITATTCGSISRLISQALPVTSSATRSRASRLSANSLTAAGFVSIRPAERTPPRSAIATSQKSMWTSSAMSRTCSPARRRARTSGQTTSTHPRSQRNRTGRRGGHRTKARARSPSSKPACPSRVLPEAPIPVARP
jgi:hypothetical protein